MPRPLLAIAVGFVLVFALGIAAVVGISNWSVPQRLTVASPVPEPTSPSLVATPAASSAASSAPAVPVPPGTVQQSDIDQLALAVKLGSGQPVGKDVWARELPIAQKLLNGMCDCDERNWLKHFIETGEQAVAGSPDYPQSLQLLTHMRRSDQDFAAQAPH